MNPNLLWSERPDPKVAKRFKEILSAKHSTQELTDEEKNFILADHIARIRAQQRKKSLSRFEKSVKPALELGNKLRSAGGRRDRESQFRRVPSTFPQANQRPESLDTLVPAGPCAVQTFQWPMSQATTQFWGSPATNFGPPGTPFVTSYGHADVATGALLAGAAAGEFSGIQFSEATDVFGNQSYVQTFAMASLAGVFRAPIGDVVRASANFHVSFDVPAIPPKPTLAFSFDNSGWAESEAVIAISWGTLDNAGNFYYTGVGCYLFFDGEYGDSDSEFSFLGQDNRISWIFFMPDGVPSGDDNATYFFSAELCLFEFAGPPDGKPRIAYTDLRGPTPEFPGYLGTLSPGNSFRVNVSEITLAACGKNPATL